MINPIKSYHDFLPAKLNVSFRLIDTEETTSVISVVQLRGGGGVHYGPYGHMAPYRHRTSTVKEPLVKGPLGKGPILTRGHIDKGLYRQGATTERSPYRQGVPTDKGPYRRYVVTIDNIQASVPIQARSP